MIADHAAIVERVEQTFAVWFPPFIEGCLVIDRDLGRVGDQDATQLLVALWQFAYGDAWRRFSGRPATLGRPSADDFLAELSEVPFFSAAALTAMTGVPRETARRKLEAMVRQGVAIKNSDSEYRLDAAAPPLPIAEAMCEGQCRWLLQAFGLPAAALSRDAMGTEWLSVMRNYLAAYTAFHKSLRERVARGSSVRVVLTMLTLNDINLRRHLMRTGPDPDTARLHYNEAVLRHAVAPVGIWQVADYSGVPVAEARAGMKAMQAAGFVDSVGRDVFVISPARILADPRHQPRFTAEAHQHIALLAQSILRAVLPAPDGQVSRT